MSTIAQQQAALNEQLMSIARQLDRLAHSERSDFIAQQADGFGVSKNTMYNWLKTRAGWSSGRKKRADAGKTTLSDTAIETGAAMQKAALRKNGKHMLSTATTLSIMQQNGIDVGVSTATYNRVLRRRGLSQFQQGAPSAHVTMRSLHPNHVHQVDPSLCVLYYMRGRQHIMEADQFYKNKWDNYAKVQMKVWRYVLVDHYSAYIVPWYVQAAGESQQNLFEFLLFAWGRQPGRDFHGPCQLLVWDLGSANTSAAIKHFLDSLEVEHIPHMPGNARAKGSVENGNNLVERLFESRLKFSPVESVMELNDAVFAWANAYNANRIPHQDTRLQRKLLPEPIARADLWHQITAGQLRILPDEAICRQFFVGKADLRKVAGDMTISYRHPSTQQKLFYDLTRLDGVNVGQQVEVCPMIYGDRLIMVSVPRYDGEDLRYQVQPINDADQAGFRANAPVFGGSHKAKPETAHEKASKRLDKTAFGDAKNRDKAVPFGGELDTHEHLKHVDLPTYLPRKGQEIYTGRRFAEQPMSVIAAAKQLKNALGGAYSIFHLNYLKQHYPEGITTTDLEALVAQFNQSSFQKAVETK